MKTAIEDGDYKAKLQKRWGNDPVQLYGQTYKVAKEGDDLYAKISHIPGNVIKVKLLLTERNKSLIGEALNGKYKLGGALLLKKGNEWMLHITIEKTASLPRLEGCETIVGVDVGIRNLAYAAAHNTIDKKFYGERFSSKGNRYNHISRTYQRKLTEVESKCGKGSKRYRKVSAKYKRVRDEIFHTVSKMVVRYAQRFGRPIIAIEDRGQMKNERQTRGQRYALSMWARSQIQQYIAYKAMWGEIPCILVDPHHTSTTCNKCDNKGERNKWQF